MYVAMFICACVFIYVMIPYFEIVPNYIRNFYGSSLSKNVLS